MSSPARLTVVRLSGKHSLIFSGPFPPQMGMPSPPIIFGAKKKYT
jgi:hypothetical protein